MNDTLGNNTETNRQSKANGFGEPRFGIAQIRALARFALKMNDKRAAAFFIRSFLKFRTRSA
jgi:hypothetical protein